MNLDLPLVFPSVEDAELKRDLERLANAVRSGLRGVADEREPVPRMSDPLLVDGAASFGQVTRIGALEDTDRLVVQLPRVDPPNAGRTLGVLRTNTLGCVYLSALGTTINGRARLMLLGSMQLTTVSFDGERYYADNYGASPWGGL